METLPFATKPLQPSTWGSNYTRDTGSFKQQPCFQPNAQNERAHHNQKEESEEPIYPSNHFEYMPAVLLNSLKRDKKPFTYTPGRLDLSEVLNAKLQKRLERKKKHLEERVAMQNVVEELPVFDQSKQVLVKPTYNSPLDMYSMENALEALEVQAEIAVAEKSLSPQRTQTLPRNYKFEVKDFEPKNVTQSKAFKVLQIITDTDEQPDEKVENHVPCHVNEMMFKGTGQQQTIPSKYFHTLQKMTGTDKDDAADSESPKYKVSQNNIEHLHTESKFTGIPQAKVIPSKYFQNLQKLTGTEGTESTSTRHENRVHDDSIPQFHTETRFSGISQNRAIPSKYFHNLQRMTDTEQQPRHTNNQIQENKNDHYKNSESKTVSFQPRNISASTSQTSIPVLQRPAAFLPAVKKDLLKKKAPCNVRFSESNVVYNHTNNLRPYEGTDF